jgi:16S rRNA (cytosine1402-N4)-methyltransferase
VHEPGHVPVLTNEITRLLAPQPGDVVVDCTAGRGGHSVILAEAVQPGGKVIGFDLDAENLAYTAERVRAAGGDFTAIHDNFAAVPGHLRELDLQANVVLADLGFASTQIDDPARGFSMFEEGPLDMRYDPATGGQTAAQLLAHLSERELADLIYDLGEDPYSRWISRKLVEARRHEPIRTTTQLARLVAESYGPKARFSRLHPATRTFMALRIAVNDELGSLRSLLEQIVKAAERRAGGECGWAWLAGGARVGIVSFHSLEDRMVKQCFVDLAKRDLVEKLTKKPVTPSEQEVQANPRARPAKLRAVRIDGAAPETKERTLHSRFGEPGHH